MTRKNSKKLFRDNSDNATKLLCDEALAHVKVLVSMPFNYAIKLIRLFQGQNYTRALTTYNKVSLSLYSVIEPL